MSASRHTAPSAHFTRADLVRDLRALGVREGDLLNVKASLKSIGHVEGGADTLLEAVLEAVGPSGTIVTDSFLNVFPLPLSRENALKLSDNRYPSYAGALANALIRHPRVKRSGHPVQKFAAIGARADELMAAHGVHSYAYDVLRVMAQDGGRNLKIGSDEKAVGVGTTHVAIGLLGLRQKRERAGVNYMDTQGRIATFERDWAGFGCVKGFTRFLPHYRNGGAVLSEGAVGLAESKITDMKRTLEIELALLRRDPCFFLCSDPDCVNCRLTWEMSRSGLTSVVFHNLRRGRWKVARQAVRMHFNQNYLPPHKALPPKFQDSVDGGDRG